MEINAAPLANSICQPLRTIGASSMKVARGKCSVTCLPRARIPNKLGTELAEVMIQGPELCSHRPGGSLRIQLLSLLSSAKPK